MVMEVRILDKEREMKEWEKDQRRKAWLETQKDE
jgi:hypothetical protein